MNPFMETFNDRQPGHVHHMEWRISCQDPAKDWAHGGRMV